MRIRVQSEPGRRMRKASYVAASLDEHLGAVSLRIRFNEAKINTYMFKHFNEVLRVRIDAPPFARDVDMIVSNHTHLDAELSEVTLESVTRKPS